MNASALQQLHRNWQAIIDGVIYLRNCYIGLAGRPTIELADCWLILAALRFLPSYLVLRAHESVSSRKLAAPVAGLYKASLGAFWFIDSILMTRILRDHSHKLLVDPEDLVRALEQSNGLIGHREVYAGPPGLIRQFFLTLTLGKDAGSRTTWLKELLPRPDLLFDYTSAMLSEYYVALMFAYELDTFEQKFSADCVRASLNGDLLMCLRKLRRTRRTKLDRAPKKIYFGATMQDRLRISKGLMALMKDVLPSEPAINVLGRTVGPAKEKSSPVHDLLAQLPLSESDESSIIEAPVIADLVSEYIVVERHFLRAFTDSEKLIYESLEREHGSAEVTSVDISESLGGTFLDLLCDSSAISIHRSASRTTVRAGSRVITVQSRHDPQSVAPRFDCYCR